MTSLGDRWNEVDWRLLNDGWEYAEGYDQMMGGMCPVQGAGKTPGGEGFYFRSRHTAARLDIWRDGWHPHANNEGEFERFINPDWSDEISLPEWTDHQAGYIEPEEAEEFLRVLYERYQYVENLLGPADA